MKTWLPNYALNGRVRYKRRVRLKHAYSPTADRMHCKHTNKGRPSQPHPRSGLHRLLRKTNHQPRKAQTPLQNLRSGDLSLDNYAK